MGKKIFTIGVRVDEKVNQIIESLANKDDRAVAAMARKLILEALENRKLLKPGERD